jgi:uncharacterized protein YfaS (alpha-2-macroglobulin family)
MWRATVHADPKGAAIGAEKFLVDDFVPPRLELALEANRVGRRIIANVEADYL